MTDTEKSTYEQKNKELVLNAVIPAYKSLAEGLKELIDCTKNRNKTDQKSSQPATMPEKSFFPILHKVFFVILSALLFHEMPPALTGHTRSFIPFYMYMHKHFFSFLILSSRKFLFIPCFICKTILLHSRLHLHDSFASFPVTSSKQFCFIPDYIFMIVLLHSRLHLQDNSVSFLIYSS